MYDVLDKFGTLSHSMADIPTSVHHRLDFRHVLSNFLLLVRRSHILYQNTLMYLRTGSSSAWLWCAIFGHFPSNFPPLTGLMLGRLIRRTLSTVADTLPEHRFDPILVQQALDST